MIEEPKCFYRHVTDCEIIDMIDFYDKIRMDNKEEAMKKTKEPKWVCHVCAAERDARISPDHIATWHTGKCGICEKTTTVTQPRDFGKTRRLLIIEDKNE